MQIKLIVVEGQAREREMLRDLPIVIGRSRAAGVTVGDPKVSRQHCFLEEHGGMVMLRDNGSLNGTLIDGQKVVGEAVLRPGAKLTVGPLTFVVIYEPTGEGVQGDTGQMAPVAAGGVDFEALLGGAGDDAETDGDESDGDESGATDEADAPAASPGNDEATLQWLPPPAASSNVPSFLPPPAATPPAAAPASPTGKRTSKAAPPAPVKPTEFDWLAAPSGGSDAESAEAADETASAPTKGAAQDDEVSAPGESAEESAEGTVEDADAEESTTESGEFPEAVAQSSTRSPAAKKAPKKKRSWWPFGKKKKPAAKSKAEPAADAAAETEPEPADPEDEETLAAKPADEKAAAEDTAGSTADTLPAKNPAAFLPPQVSADAQEEDDEDGGDFNQFLKGLK